MVEVYKTGSVGINPVFLSALLRADLGCREDGTYRIKVEAKRLSDSEKERLRRIYRANQA